MGTKKPSCSLLDSNVNMSNHKLQPGGRISRDPSPRPAMMAQSDRDRDRDREDVRRSESQAVKMRDKARYKDVETMERLYERERRRDGERRERWPEEDRGRNGRPLSNQEEVGRDIRKGQKKGDTFPRVKKDNRRMTPCDERGERRPRRGDEEGWNRTWYREEDRPRDRNQESDLQGQDWRREVEVRVRDEGRRREREVRVSSPHRRRDREVHSDRRERKEGRRDTRSEGDSEERETRRERAKREEVVYQNSRSEGDNKRDRESEEDRTRRRTDRHRRAERQEDRYNRKENRYDRKEERKEDRYDRKEDRYDRKEDRYDRKEDRYDRKEDRFERKEDRYDRKEVRKEDKYDRKEDRFDRKEDRYDRKEVRKEDKYDRKEVRKEDKYDRKEDRYDRKEVRKEDRYDRKEDRFDRKEERKEDLCDRKDRYKRKEERFDRKEDDAFRRQRTDQDRVPPKPPPRAQSSGEWSSDSESRFRRDKDRRDLERRHEGRSEGGVGEATGGVSEQRRMWLEPQRNTREPSVDRERHTRQRESRMEAEEKEPEEGRYRGGQGETEGVSVDREEVQEEHLSDSDGEEEGGSDYWARSEDSEGGSDADWRQERDRMLSGEDGFVTVSSSGDREDEEDEEFVDCREFWDVRDDSPGEEEEPKYVFCVTGQTLPRSQAGHMGGAEASLETHHDDLRCGQHRNTSQEPEEPISSELQEPRVILRSKAEHPYDEVGTIKRDHQTERLLKEWRQKNKDPAARDTDQTSPLPRNPYADVCSQVGFENIQPILDQINSGAMSPEEVEAIRIRMSGAWSMSEEPKRHSQAPHLKWAKNVVREILGRSEEGGVDEPNAPEQPEPEEEEEEEAPEVQLTPEEDQSEEELEGLRGTRSSRAGMHVEQQPDMHVKTNTQLEADRQGGQAERKDVEGGGKEEAGSKRKEVEMFLSVSGTLYKPSSCPILNYESTEGEEEVEEVGKVEAVEAEGRQEVEMDMEGRQEVEMDMEGRQEVEMDKGKVGTLTSSCSFRDLGPEARIRRRGIRKTTERRNGELVEVEEEEEEGVGRDRRTRIFSATDDEDDRSKSWGEVELRNVLDTLEKRRRNSKFFNAAQLYQQYSEAAQNSEILRQARSDVLSVCEENIPAPSPPPACRPLPPLPPVPHPHSLISSTHSLTLPEPPRTERRSSSPRLSISLSGQSASLWRELPGVRNSVELEELSEDQRRLQEVRFEVVTSEASYCRSLDIVVDHFVKSKQLGAKLTNQDRNWLFSRLADVRAISHSFLSKLEERVESDIMHFTVCDIIARHCQRFRMVYVPYLTNQSYQDATYQRLMNENQEFKQLVAKLERSPVCQRLPLRSFLVLPFQRITRIKLLVQNIVKRTTPGTAEALQAIKAMKLLEKLIQESNDSISQMKSIESLVSLSAKVDFECRTLPLVSQSRRLVREGPVTELMDFSLKDRERSIYLHLFNDYLLLSLQKEGGRFTVIDHSPVSDLRAENCRVKLHSLQKNLFRLHMSHKALLLRTDTQSDKLRWISALSRPHQEIDFSAAQDFEQMQCIRAFVAQQPDELSLEKADVILVHQQSSDNWVEGTRLSDRHRGWMPKSHLETISNSRVRQRNLSDALKLTTATAAV